MITKAQIKQIRLLKLKKERESQGVFVAEGKKVVCELLGSMPCAALYLVTGEQVAPWQLRLQPLSQQVQPELVSEGDMARMSFLKDPQEVLALFYLPRTTPTPALDQLTLVLDEIQDPGNMGTIVRIADWYGIHTIYASPHTADVFAPKCVQATMGSLARVQVCYTDIVALLQAQPPEVPIYGTTLQGCNMYDTPLRAQGFLVMGNEGQGITPAVQRCLTQALYIPSFPPGAPTAESLNVAIATGIICAEMRRLSLSK